MTREDEIVKAAKEHEKGCEFGELVLSSKSRGVNSAYGIGFLEGSEWADKTMLDKACKWLEDNYTSYFNHKSCESELTYIDDFKKAMEK